MKHRYLSLTSKKLLMQTCSTEPSRIQMDTSPELTKTASSTQVILDGFKLWKSHINLHLSRIGPLQQREVLILNFK